MSKILPAEPIRQAFRQSLPGIDPSEESSDRLPFTYVPPSHARALDPDSVLVEGIRGAGKSFWWSALNQDGYRRFVATAFPETRLKLNTEVGPGYGVGSLNDSFPKKDVIQSLSKKYDPRNIWKAVIAHHLKFPVTYPSSGKWDARVHWVLNHPEEFEEFLSNADKRFLEKKQIMYFCLTH